jgi:hypothetical protein
MVGIELHPALSLYMERAGGGRTIGFSPSDGVRVLVEPQSSEHNPDAVRFAMASYDTATTIAGYELRLAALKRENKALEDSVRQARNERDLARSALPPPAPARLAFGPGYVRFTDNGEIWLLGSREKGWSAFGFRFASWDELFRRWDGRVTEHGTDEHGAWWKVESPAVVGSLDGR